MFVKMINIKDFFPLFPDVQKKSNEYSATKKKLEENETYSQVRGFNNNFINVVSSIPFN